MLMRLFPLVAVQKANEINGFQDPLQNRGR
jgi:hypothetical protein